ncbi:MAG: hypothetical protein AB7J13_10580, partial [Pyrinomonadaceae bacterium]
RKSEGNALTAISLVVISCSHFYLKFVGFTLVASRHLSGLILPLIIIPIEALRSLNSRRAIYGWAALVIAINLASLFFTYKPLAKPGDFERVAQYLMANEQPGEPILIFHADAILPLRHYYKGSNDLVAIPQENGTEAWDPRNNILRNEAQILSVFDAHPSTSGRMWLAHDGWCANGSIRFNCELLEDVLGKYFVIEGTENFYGPVTVRRLRRR